MKIELNILKATILVGRGPDKIMLETDKTEWCYPFNGPLTISFQAATGTGYMLLYDMFNIEALIIDIS